MDAHGSAELTLLVAPSRKALAAPGQRQALLDQILGRAGQRCGLHAGCLLLHRDGLLVAGHAPSGVDGELATAHCAMAWEQAERMARDGMGAELGVLGITLEKQQFWIQQVRHELLAVVWLPAHANLGGSLGSVQD